MPSFLKPLNIEKEKETLKELLKKELPNYIDFKSDDFNIMISVMLYYLGLQVDKINYIISQNYLSYSSGEFLDELCSLIGITRIKQTKPVSKIHIKVKDEIKLFKGTKFISKDGMVANLDKDYIIKDEAIINVIGEKEGDWKTEILEIANPLILEIKVLEPFKIYSSLESDFELKQRFKNALARFSTAGSESSYLFYSKVQGVLKLKVFSNTPGVVEIIYHSLSDTSENEILNNLKDKIPLTDEVRIQKAFLKPLDLNIKIISKSIINNNLIKALQANIQGYLKSLEIGESIKINKLLSLCFIDESIKDIQADGLFDLEYNELYEIKSLNIGF